MMPGWSSSRRRTIGKSAPAHIADYLDINLTPIQTAMDLK
jgi:hypothetical protein